jgi:hypothetical protein
MSLKPRLTKLAVDAEAEAISKLLDGGWCEFFDGNPPDEPEGPPAAASLLARCKFAEKAFGRANNGILVANKAERAVAVATGEPTWMRCTTPDGRVIMDGTAGTSNANAVMNAKSMVQGQFVDITGFKFVIPKTL